MNWWYSDLQLQNTMKLKSFLRTHFYIFMKIIHSRLYPLFPLTKELLVGFLSVKVTWFISCFSGTLNKMLDLHRNSSSLQNQPTASSGKSELFWAVPCWSCGKPKKGLQYPCNALHVQVLLLHPKWRAYLFRHTVLYESNHFWTVWHQQICISMKIYLNFIYRLISHEKSVLTFALMWPWGHF